MRRLTVVFLAVVAGCGGGGGSHLTAPSTFAPATTQASTTSEAVSTTRAPSTTVTTRPPAASSHTTSAPAPSTTAAAPHPAPTTTLGPHPTPTAAIAIQSYMFSPKTLHVAAGTKVTTTNQQAGIPHTWTADGGAWDSGQLSTGQSYSHTFATAGTFTYHCNIHSFMTGTVVVS